MGYIIIGNRSGNRNITRKCTINSSNISAVDGTFTGNVSIAGTITYDDVTHVDSQGIGTFRQGINVVGHSEVDTLRVSGVSTFQSNVDFPDNVKLNIGTGDDLQLLHNNSDSVISHIGSATGNLKILSGGAQSIECVKVGAVELYHNGNKKFETTGVGATVTGEMYATTFHGDGSKLTGVAAAGSGGGALDITSCLFI